MSSDVIMDLKDDIETHVNIDFYRSLVRLYQDLHLYNTALFWAEKVVTLTKEREQDVYLLAQTMHASKQYQRAAHLIKSRNLHKSSLPCLYLTAASLREAKESNEALQLLLLPCDLTQFNQGSSLASGYMEMSRIDNSSYPENTLAACMHLELGRVYESLDNRELAADSYKQALQFDLHCYDAFEALIDQQMLNSQEEAKLMNEIPFSKHCSSKMDQNFVRYLYENKLNKYRGVDLAQSSLPDDLLRTIKNSLDVKVAEAERHYYNADFASCWKISQEVMSKDPYHNGCLAIHISCLVQLKNSNDLFLLAHRLVAIYPEQALSWYAIGCYYYVIHKSELTRKYLAKATSLNKLFAPAWLAFGHSFALEKEHDQAMAAYFKAAQLMQGCHLPLLYIGLQNGLTNNAVLAEKFFLQASAIAPDDPFVIHERGVIAFQSEKYDKAKKLFEKALSKIKTTEMSIIQDIWEPLLNNLGHTYRKLQMYEKSIEFHLQAKLLLPNDHSTYAAIGFCELLMGKTQNAAESFHKALSLKRDDTFATSMLTDVLDILIQENKEPEESDVDLSDIRQFAEKTESLLDSFEGMEGSSMMTLSTQKNIRRGKSGGRKEGNSSLGDDNMVDVSGSSIFL